jgi:2-hydroxy-3-oxopropionate reductase
MRQEHPKTVVGFIGLGVMGMPMARNLLKVGYPVVALDVLPDKAAELAEAGASIAESPAAVARAADLVVTMLTDAPVVEQVLFGPASVSEGSRPGQIVIDASTISPIATRSMAARLAELGVMLLDAPVSGGQKGAADGTLSFMVGGDFATFERCLPIFEAMGSRITWIGESGAGQIAKACNQSIIAVSRVGISEALLLAARSGVDPARVREALLGGFAGSLLLEVQGKRMLDRTFEPGFRAALHYKDLGIARSLAQSVQSPAPATGLALDLFGSLLARGSGNLDHSAIVTSLEALAGSAVALPEPARPQNLRRRRAAK